MPIEIKCTCDNCGISIPIGECREGELKLPRVHNSFFGGDETVRILVCKNKACIAARLQQILIEYKLLEPTKK